eukprot:TRINITY_DN6757_c0_g1_i1.p3 TRINITY_DN6757_c0_g1~~TRINITY_DN6757_c0_g1_i1.p3  ORF type:complete len:155 (+),score=65.02 TRINITY_DN6757_c0_g1_i1:3-467(+)
MSALEEKFRNSDGISDALLSDNELTSLFAALQDEIRNPEPDDEEEEASHAHEEEDEEEEGAKDDEEEEALNGIVQEIEKKLHPDEDPMQTLHEVAGSLGVEDNELENALHRAGKKKKKQKKEEKKKEKEEEEKEKQREKEEKEREKEEKEDDGK